MGAVLTVAFLPVHDLVCLVFWAFFFSLGLVELSCLLLTSFFFSFSLKLYCVCCSPWGLPAWFFACLPLCFCCVCVSWCNGTPASHVARARMQRAMPIMAGWLLLVLYTLFSSLSLPVLFVLFHFFLC